MHQCIGNSGLVCCLLCASVICTHSLLTVRQVLYCAPRYISLKSQNHYTCVFAIPNRHPDKRLDANPSQEMYQPKPPILGRGQETPAAQPPVSVLPACTHTHAPFAVKCRRRPASVSWPHRLPARISRAANDVYDPSRPHGLPVSTTHPFPARLVSCTARSSTRIETAASASHNHETETASCVSHQQKAPQHTWDLSWVLRTRSAISGLNRTPASCACICSAHLASTTTAEAHSALTVTITSPSCILPSSSPSMTEYAPRMASRSTYATCMWRRKPSAQRTPPTLRHSHAQVSHSTHQSMQCRKKPKLKTKRKRRDRVRRQMQCEGEGKIKQRKHSTPRSMAQACSAKHRGGTGRRPRCCCCGPPCGRCP